MAKLYSRAIAAVMDMFLLLVIAMVGGFCALEIFGVADSLFQVLPFIIIECVICPLSSLVTGTFQASMPIYGMVLGSLFLVEVLYYFVSYRLATKATLGQRMVGIKIQSAHGANKQKPLVRALVKVILRYLFYLPCLVSLFNVKQQMLHDKVAKTVVIKAGSVEEVWKTNN